MSDPSSLPVLFISHGAPTYALEPGASGARLGELGASIVPRPKAVLVVSPHWMTRGGVRVTTSARPGTIHDFGAGFPRELFALRYSAPGAPAVAARAIELLRAAGLTAAEDDARGLDHGAWVPLMHLFPAADVPALQVSMPAELDGNSALALGRALAPLAAEGVLVVGSGSLTHNLAELRWTEGESVPDAHATAFVDWIRATLESHDTARLARTMAEAPHAARAHPTTEHFLPLVVAAGAAQGAGDSEMEVVEGGWRMGNLSMESYFWRATAAVAA